MGPLGVEAGRGHASTNDHNRRVERLGHTIADGEQLRIRAAVQHIAPLADQVWLVPHLDGLNLPAITLDQPRNKHAKVAQIGRAAIRRVEDARVNHAGVGGRSRDAQQHFEALRMGRRNHAVEAGPIKRLRRGLNRPPAHLLLDPRQPHPLGDGQRARHFLVAAVDLDAELGRVLVGGEGRGRRVGETEFRRLVRFGRGQKCLKCRRCRGHRGCRKCRWQCGRRCGGWCVFPITKAALWANREATACH